MKCVHFTTIPKRSSVALDLFGMVVKYLCLNLYYCNANREILIAMG
jgi:hypothetical protein